MNKSAKVMIAILGAVDVVFRIATPLLISLLIVNTSVFNNEAWTTLLLLTGMLSSLYRGIEVGFLRA